MDDRELSSTLRTFSDLHPKGCPPTMLGSEGLVSDWAERAGNHDGTR
jgi:hypothetical protein